MILPALAVSAALFMLSCGREGPLPPPDKTPPRVSATVPANGSSNVPVNLNGGIVITFSKRMDVSTIDTQTITLADDQSSISGSVSYADVGGVPNAVFAPLSSLKPATLYHLDVASSVKDVYGISMDAPYVCIFYTATAPDTTPPAVDATVPSQGDPLVAPNTAIGVAFSEPVVPTTIAFSLSTGTAAVPCVMTYSGMTAMFTPFMDLAFGTAYTARVSAGVTELTGNAMQNDYVWSFTTMAAVSDTIPPVVAFATPTGGATGVAVNVLPGVTFSEPVDPATIAFTLSSVTATVPCGMNYSGTAATFMPYTVLAFDTLYTATVSAGVKDLAGNPMQNDYVWSFVTMTAVSDTKPPVVTAATPSGGATGVAVNVLPGVTFSEPVVPASIVFTLSSGTTTVPCGMNYNGTVATFMPYTVLAFDTLYTATVSAGVKDLAGNPMQNDYVWSFITGEADTVPPGVAAVFPAPGAANINAKPIISMMFTEVVDPATIAFSLTDGTTAATCPLLYSGVTATCTPSSPLKKATLYNAQIKSGVKDLSGNAMPGDYSWSFKTK